MANSGSLNLENLIDPEDLFRISGDDSFIDETNNPEDKQEPDDNENNTHQDIDGGDGSDLFSHQESVDDQDGKDPGEGSGHKKVKGSSPNNIYSSIAKDFKEDGVFPDLDETEISDLDSPEKLSELIKKQIYNQLDATQKRVYDAINADIEPSKIKQFENMIDYLDNISEDEISSESDEAVKLRQNLIYRDLINRGYKEDRAKRAVQKSFDNGNDVEDAKDALANNKDYFKSQYDNLIKEAQAEKEQEIRQRQAEMDKVKKSILDGEPILGNFVVPETIRQKAFDSISKPVYKDPETGEMLSAVQKYANDNHYDFLKITGIIYAMTNGFKDMSGLIKGEVNKTTKKSLKNLTDALNNTTRNSDGSFRLANKLGEEDTYSGSDDWTLDV